MISVGPATPTDGSCVDCGKPAVIRVQFQYSPQASQSFTLCAMCRRDFVHKLLPPVKKPSVPRQALQLVFDMACTMACENSYSRFDKENGSRIGPRADVANKLYKVKNYFKLRGSIL